MSSAQSEMLASERVDELLVCTDRKQRYIDGINIIDTEVSLLEEKLLNLAGISSWEEGKKFFNEQWEAVENLRNEIILLLQKTQRLDRKNIQNINCKHLELKKDIEFLRVRKEFVRAYLGLAAQSAGFFIDKKE